MWFYVTNSAWQIRQVLAQWWLQVVSPKGKMIWTVLVLQESIEKIPFYNLASKDMAGVTPFHQQWLKVQESLVGTAWSWLSRTTLVHLSHQTQSSIGETTLMVPFALRILYHFSCRKTVIYYSHSKYRTFLSKSLCVYLLSVLLFWIFAGGQNHDSTDCYTHSKSDVC